MSSMNIALLGILIASLLIQLFLAAGFVFRLQRWRTPLNEDASCPQAVVVLCLRGGDPFLAKCIDGLLSQNYPCFHIQFMLDHLDDPALPILKKSLENVPVDRYQIHFLESPLETCSLKCSCLVQAIEGLPGSVEVLALLDADTIPHSNWLRELTTALSSERVGAATGNRWYLPTHSSRGALVRYVWNAAAVVQMYWYEIAWGGTLAIKLESIRRAGILDRWRLAYGEDTMVRKALSEIGEKVAFVPSLMMINREDCTLTSFRNWVKRQLLSARLYHPFWLWVVGHAIFSAALIICILLSSIAIAIQGDFIGAGVLLLSLFVYQLCLTSMLPWIERAVCTIAQSRGEEIDWPSKPSWLKLLWIAWLTQWTYTWALLSCLFMKRFNWRGIEYEVDGPWSIRMMGYHPFRSERTEPDSTPRSI